ncbi:hypothetical protein M758_6G029300 [Ceratodon purpureus]|nr:hypothetical protein M758_6G029300 [Ceratodon purpureus]
MAVQRNFVAVVIAVLLSLHVSTNVVTYADIIVLPKVQVSALMDLFRDWQQHTEDVNSSLPGWRLFDPNITADDVDGYYDPCFFYSWRGIFCDIVMNETASAGRNELNSLYNARIVSITVSGASIVGTLPTSIWNIDSLVSLTLTENPQLNGSLPIPDLTVQNGTNGWPLKSLDLHSNGFNGQLQDPLFTWFNFIEDLDLSNNQLKGSIPVSLGFNERLRSLNLSNNTLTGNLPRNISENWTNLVTADFSKNKFTGNMPNLSTVASLHTLNLSHNNFVGPIDISVLNALTKASLTILDLSNNNFTGPMPNLGECSNLASLSLSYNSFDAGACPSWLSNLTTLEILSLSGTSLTRELHMSTFSSLKQLKTLELDDNNITGTLNIDSTINNGTLQTIRLRRNQISKVVFSSNSISALPNNISFELQGNPYCDNTKPAKYTDTQRCLCEQRCYDTNPYSKTNKKIIIGSAVAGSFAAVMLIIAAILYWKNRRDRRYLLLAVHEKFAEYEMKPTLFAYSELQKATRDFHPDNKLGEGGFGAVYKGTLVDGSVVAVKQLLTRAQQNMDDFLNEVVLLTTVKHRNLVKLKGCCLRGDRRLLVYEFVDNYDLAETLFERRGNQLVTWPARFNICLGVAQGLHYLHAGVDPRIIHRDIKANNILLDQSLHPKIADFGLAMLFPNEDTHVTIVQIAGTKGYLAPEYATRGQVSDKVDVFSFGVLALEVVSGRKNISFDVPPEEAYLTDWAWKLNEEGRLMELVDPSISIQLDEEVEVYRVITTALACIQTAAERRPSMAHVVGMLQGDIEITESIRGHWNENQSHRILLGLSSSATTLVPVDEESQALHLGQNSGSTSGPRALIELSSIRAR